MLSIFNDVNVSEIGSDLYDFVSDSVVCIWDTAVVVTAIYEEIKILSDIIDLSFWLINVYFAPAGTYGVISVFFHVMALGYWIILFESILLIASALLIN